MKVITMFVFVSFFIALQVNAQSGWDWQNPLPQGNDLYSVHMFDQNTVIAVGIGSTVMKTTDAGNSWTIRRFADGTENGIRSLYFFNSLIGVAVGAQGTIIRTTDAGTTWTTQTTGTTRSLFSVHFNDVNNGIAVGRQGTILHTSDGGFNWTLQSSNTDYDLWGISYLSNATAIAVGGGYDTLFPYESHQIIIRTTDNGANWIPVYAAPKCTLNVVCFADESDGWAASCDSIYHTTDGGITWFNQTAGSARGFFFFDSNVGFAVSGQIVRKTTDGGNSWTNDTLETNSMLSIKFYDANNGFIVGSTGTILKTTDGGINWQLLTSDILLERPGNQFTGVSFSDPNNGVCVNSRLVFNTTNGGSSWIERPTDIIGQFSDVEAIDANHWIVTDNYSMLTTTNAGSSWIRDTLYKGSKIQCFDANNCVVLGDSVGSYTGYLSILKTTDGGFSWHRIVTDISPPEYYSGIFFTDQLHGTIVNGTRIYQTSDGGFHWIQRLNYDKSLQDVFFLSSTNGVVVGGGSSGVILRTTDSGQTWLPADADTSRWFAAITFVDANIGYAVGYLGNILKTTDGGASWTRQLTGVDNTFYAVAAPDANNATVVGNIHGIMHTSSGGVSEVEENTVTPAPRQYDLDQNYPNPFNPSTVIEFSVPYASYVTLKVFDVLGQTISTLVNEPMSAGSYSVSWNATGIASGVYFYRLQAESFSETKKLVLLR